MAQTDTLRHIFPGQTLVKYRYTGEDFGIKKWGYFSGHNIYADLGWAEFYEVTDSVRIVGVVAHHYGTSTSTTKEVSYHLYRPVGTQPKPLIELTGQSVTHDKLHQDGTPTYVAFSTPIKFKGKFFVTFEVPDYLHTPSVLGNDTLVLLTSEDGTRDAADLSNYGRNMVRFHQSSETPGWNDVYTEMDQQYKLHFALYPVVEYLGTGTYELAPADGFVKWRGASVVSGDELGYDFSLKLPATVNWHVLDMSGRSCLEMAMGGCSAGLNTGYLDMHGLVNGSYILVLEAGPYRLARKILVQH